MKGAQLPPRELRYGDFQQVRNDGEGTRGRHRSRRLPTITQFGLKLYGNAEQERTQEWPSSSSNASHKPSIMSENTMGGGGYSNRDYNGKIRPQEDSYRSNGSSQRSINPYKQEPRQGGSGYRPNLNSYRDDYQQQSINPYRNNVQQISNPRAFNNFQQIHEQSQSFNRFSRQPAPRESQKNSSSGIDSGDIDDLLNMLPSKKK